MTTKTNNPAWYSPTYTYSLIGITCCNCGVLFGMEEGYYNDRRQDRKSWSCPNGHQQHFTGKTDAEIAREQRDAARALAQRESDRRRAAERSAAAHKGWATRIRNRIANGVCPCCNRSFSNVLRHMNTKHPDFQIPETD